MTTVRNRKTLREYFRANAKPTGTQFAELIESCFNREDDDIESRLSALEGDESRPPEGSEVSERTRAELDRLAKSLESIREEVDGMPSDLQSKLTDIQNSIERIAEHARSNESAIGVLHSELIERTEELNIGQLEERIQRLENRMDQVESESGWNTARSQSLSLILALSEGDDIGHIVAHRYRNRPLELELLLEFALHQRDRMLRIAEHLKEFEISIDPPARVTQSTDLASLAQSVRDSRGLLTTIARATKQAGADALDEPAPAANVEEIAAYMETTALVLFSIEYPIRRLG